MCMYGHAKVVVPEQKRLSRPLGDELHAFLFDNPLVIFSPGKSHYGKNKHHLIKVKLDFWQSQKISHDNSGISTQNIYLFIYLWNYRFIVLVDKRCAQKQTTR